MVDVWLLIDQCLRAVLETGSLDLVESKQLSTDRLPVVSIFMMGPKICH